MASGEVALSGCRLVSKVHDDTELIQGCRWSRVSTAAVRDGVRKRVSTYVHMYSVFHFDMYIRMCVYLRMYVHM